MIGQHTDAVRAVVKQNADALRQAARDLQEADNTSVAALSSTTAVIDQTAEDTTHQDVQASQTFLANEAAQQTASTAESAAAATNAAQGKQAAGGDAL